MFTSLQYRFSNLSSCPAAIPARLRLQDWKSSAGVVERSLHTRLLVLAALLTAIVFSLAFCQRAFATDPPVITPSTGVYSTTQATATIAGDAGATLYYTTDGSIPTIASNVYSTPIPLGSTNSIKAIADLSGTFSTVTTANIQNDPTTVSVPRTDLVLWLRPEFIIASGGSATSWSDLSGSIPSNDATQTVTHSVSPPRSNRLSLLRGRLTEIA